MSYAISTLALIFIFVGLWSLHSRNRVRHAVCMGIAFVLDLGLVLYIELSRHAVDRVAHSTSPLLWFHVAISTAALVLYLVQGFLGYRLYRGNAVARPIHRWCGIAFLVLRLGNYVTSFLVATPQP